jgi:hypothetical protein
LIYAASAGHRPHRGLVGATLRVDPTWMVVVPMPRSVRVLNEALALLLELCALALFGWWGFTAGNGAVVHVLGGLGLPLAATVLWGLFAAPKARIRLPLAGALAVKAVVFGGAMAALWAVGHPALATVFGVLVVCNTAAVTVERSSSTTREL